MKSVIVTGASGFIGSRCLQKFLDRGYKVHAVSRGITSIPGVQSHRLDLLADDATAGLIERVGASHFLHLAWIASPGVFWSSPANLEWLKSSMVMAAAFYKSGGSRFVGVGSCAEYGAPSAGPCRETSTPLLPQSVYGSTKAAMSFGLQSAAAVHDASWAWARVFFPYGTGEPKSKLVSSIFAQLDAGAVPELRDPHRLLDFIHVEDAAEALVALTDSTAEGPSNVGSGVATSIRDVAKVIVARFYPAFLGAFESSVCAGPGRDPALFADIGRLTKEIGFRPSYSLVEGISEMSMKR